MPIRWNPLLFIQCLLLGMLSGCAALPSASMEESGFKSIEYVQINHGSPVVVFENGLAASMDCWSEVFSELGKDTTVFAYNRPGYGNSSDATTARDGSTVVEELRELLHSRGLSPPYILVGHSLGGLYMQLFAREHPDEVAGLVLVDAPSPSQFIGEGATRNRPVLSKFLLQFLNESQSNELLATEETARQILRLPTLSNKPVIILRARQRPSSEILRFLNPKNGDLIRSYPDARQIWVESGHFIQDDKPEVVMQAIKTIATESSRSQLLNVH